MAVCAVEIWSTSALGDKGKIDLSRLSLDVCPERVLCVVFAVLLLLYARCCLIHLTSERLSLDEEDIFAGRTLGLALASPACNRVEKYAIMSGRLECCLCSVPAAHRAFALRSWHCPQPDWSGPLRWSKADR